MRNASQFRSIWTEANGVRMHAMAADGPKDADPVVLVHGLGLSHRYMMPTAQRLAGDFRVLVPDLPGFGESGHPKEILDVPGLADGLAAWIVAAGLGRAALLGNSHACQIIIDLATRHPDRVSVGVLQGPTTPPDERSWLRQFVRWRQNAPFNPPELGPLTWGEYRKSGYLRVLGTFRHTLRDRPEDKCAKITAPMLVVRGQLDPICHEDWAEDLADRLPNGRIALIPGVAHTLVFTAPDQLATVARQFLRERRNPPGPPALFGHHRTGGFPMNEDSERATGTTAGPGAGPGRDQASKPAPKASGFKPNRQSTDDAQLEEKLHDKRQEPPKPA